MEPSATMASSKPPVWYWIVAGLGLLWMLFGVAAWVADFAMDESALAQMTEAQQQLYRSRPQWIFGVYGLAIFSGLAGVIGLLLRKAWSTLALGISLGAVIVQFAYTFFVMDAVRLLGAGTALPFPILIFAIGAGLLWLSLFAKKSGWIAD